MSIPKDLVRDHKGLSEWCILSGYRGSIAHGTYRPPKEPNSIDDKDAMAICVLPEVYYLGLKNFGSRGTQEIKRDEWDIVIYDVRKFISLLAKGNPNVMSLLWLSPQYYLTTTPAGQQIIDRRDIFSAKHVYRSFTGYAYSQLSRMERHEHHGYMGEKRKQLVEQHGHDTKNASHLIRLLRMSIEFLNTGELFVEREDASQLIDIKRGLWTLERVKLEADSLFKRAETAYLRSSLPEKPDMDEVNALCVAVIQTAWGN